MAWARIDENAMDHPKIGNLPDGAFRLWVQGLAHCQKYLTDGYISDGALRLLRAYSPKRKAVLIEAGLWEESETGIRVHDYLDWNDSREHVTAARKYARERMTRLRGSSRGSSRDVRANTERSSHGVTQPTPRTSTPRTSTERERTPAAQPPKPLSPGDNPALSERAGRFLERYADLYQKHRKGARYLGKPAIDFQEALQLVKTWEDDERLDKIATVFLTTDHRFAEEGSRTVGQLRALASWCDGRLREAGL